MFVESESDSQHKDSGSPSKQVDTGDSRGTQQRDMLTATFSGSVRGLDGQDIQGETICITAFDQVHALHADHREGGIEGEFVELGSSVVDSEGGWTIPDMVMEAYFGPLLRVDDCDGADDLLFPTHNWILPARYRHLADYESLEDIVLTASHRSHIEILTYNLRIHNPTASIEAGGAMVGTVHQDDGTLVSGASVSCVDGYTANSVSGVPDGASGVLRVVAGRQRQPEHGHRRKRNVHDPQRRSEHLPRHGRRARLQRLYGWIRRTHGCGGHRCVSEDSALSASPGRAELSKVVASPALPATLLVQRAGVNAAAGNLGESTPSWRC